MGLFGSKKKNYAGVDIGSGSLKLVELSDDRGKPRLETYGYVDVGDLFSKGTTESLSELAGVFQALRKKSRSTASLAVTAIPMHSVFSSVLHLPKMKSKEMEAAVKWEAKKIIPLPLEEMILDWRVIEDKKHQEESGNSTRVLLTSTPKELVQRYIRAFKAFGVQLLSLETEAFALTRSLIGNDSSTIMLVDMGHKTTNITIVSGGIPMLSRSVSSGGQEVTAVIAQKMGLAEAEAEDYKRDLRGELSGDLQAAFKPVIDEIRYSFTLFENQHKSKIEKAVLTGGSAALPGLTSHLSGLLLTKVYVGNPWARLVYPEDLQAALERVGPSLAMSVGLAMREIS